MAKIWWESETAGGRGERDGENAAFAGGKLNNNNNHKNKRRKKNTYANGSPDLMWQKIINIISIWLRSLLLAQTHSPPTPHIEPNWWLDTTTDYSQFSECVWCALWVCAVCGECALASIKCTYFLSHRLKPMASGTKRVNRWNCVRVRHMKQSQLNEVEWICIRVKTASLVKSANHKPSRRINFYSTNFPIPGMWNTELFRSLAFYWWQSPATRAQSPYFTLHFCVHTGVRNCVGVTLHVTYCDLWCRLVSFGAAHTITCRRPSIFLYLFQMRLTRPIRPCHRWLSRSSSE